MKRVLRIVVFLLLSLSLMACEENVPQNSPNETPEQENDQQNGSENQQQDDEKNEPENQQHEDKENDGEANKDDTESVQTTPPTDGSIESGKGGFLWRVENGNTTVYLQGTVHIGTEDFYPFHDSIEQAYESADVIVPEIDVTDVDLLSSLGSTFTQGMYLDGTTIEDHVPKEVYEKLEKAFDKYGMPMEVIGLFKPWMLDATITQLIAEELDYMHGVDMYFLERATEDDKEILELESVSDQYDVLAGQSDEFQIEQLESTLDSIDFFEETMQEVFSVYLEGNEHALLELLFPEEAEMDEEYRAYMKALNDDRNVTMAEKITEFLNEDSGKTYFIIVGTAHLIKDPHIRTFLEEEGFEVERVY